MSAVLPRFTAGPRTYDVVEAVTGGQLVEARTNGVGVAGAASVKVLGIAMKDATNAAPATTNADPTPSTCPVAYEGEFVVTYAAAANFGDRLKAAATGQVTPMVLGTDADHLCIGTCTEEAGVGAGATGLARIDVYGI
jgi:hypothetical protein